MTQSKPSELWLVPCDAVVEPQQICERAMWRVFPLLFGSKLGSSCRVEARVDALEGISDRKGPLCILGLFGLEQWTLLLVCCMITQRLESLVVL
jgi:hypothetical protein